MSGRRVLAGIAAAALGGLGVPVSGHASAAGGDAKAGERTFAQCRACHKVDTSGTSTIGPNLNRVVGRRAGTLPGFRFSPTMAASNRVWTEAALNAYLENPARNMPGNRMPFGGIGDPVVRRNLIAYLKSASR